MALTGGMGQEVQMNKQEILTKAIEKALNNGWAGDVLSGDVTDDYSNYRNIIFNHDFAKALWGDDLWWIAKPGKSGEHRQELQVPAWQIHLQQMVIAEDPIQYLEENI
jgi:hypothetical protein